MEPTAATAATGALGCAVAWLGWSVLVGALANQLPPQLLERDSWLTAPRPWADSPRSYERHLGIRRWKDWLPDAGNALPRGVTKASLVRRDRATLQRLVIETRRAELVHLALWPLWITTALWLPPAGVLVNLLFATAFNLPCLWLQRYNRKRLQALLQAPSSRLGRSRATASGAAPIAAQARPCVPDSAPDPDPDPASDSDSDSDSA